jgi:lipopolysaccharide export LptBFGC system permease protein LptF
MIVFVITHITLLVIYILHIFFAKDQLSTIAPTIIVMFVTNGVTFIGGNSFEAWQRSKYYRIELDDNAEKK